MTTENQLAKSHDIDEQAAIETFRMMESGIYEDFERLIHPEWVNHEAKDEPPAARDPYGLRAAYATALWLRGAYAGLAWEIHEIVRERDLVVVHCTMSGAHKGDFVAYDIDANVKEAFPPTGKSFVTTQTHWIRMRDG